MKILYDYEVFTYQKYGGIARYFTALISSLQQHELANCRIGAKLAQTEYLFDSGLAAQFNLHRFPLPDWRWAKIMASRFNRICFNRLVERNDFDLLHLTFYPAALTRNRVRKPVVITIHDMTPELFPQYFKGAQKWVEAKRYWAKEADLIIAVSDNTRNDLLRIYNISPAKVRVIYHAASLRPGAHAVSGLPQRYLLFVGTRAGYKNFATLLAGLSLLLRQDRELCLLCAGGGTLSAAEKALAARLSIAPQIIQRDFAESEMMQVYQQARALVYPSLYEGFGLPVLEAFAAGVPVVASRGGALPEIAADAALYFNPSDEQAITKTVQKVLGDVKTRAQLIALGEERSRFFSWDKTARDTAAAYSQLL